MCMGILVICQKRLLLRCIHHFKSDLINNMDHMCIRVLNPHQWSLYRRDEHDIKEYPRDRNQSCKIWTHITLDRRKAVTETHHNKTGSGRVNLTVIYNQRTDSHKFREHWINRNWYNEKMNEWSMYKWKEWMNGHNICKCNLVIGFSSNDTSYKKYKYTILCQYITYSLFFQKYTSDLSTALS